MSLFHPAVTPGKLNRFVPAASRFWAQTNKLPADPELAARGCWQWTGGTDEHGYGRIKRNGKTIHAHVFAWELFNGPMEPGMWGLHKCDHPVCVNPEHIYPGTQIENMRDVSVRLRRAGERNPRAKLGAEDVRAMRAMWEAGERNKSKLSRIYNVSNALVGKIIRRELWKHI